MPRKSPIPDLPNAALDARAAELDAAANDGGPNAVGFGRALAELEAEGAIRIEDVPEGELGFAPKPPEPEDAMIRAVVPATAPSNSVIVGMGMLASMDEGEYEAKKAVLSRGIARVKDLQQTLMVDREDYGRVIGISKPFLQLPGAEKLAIFYGYSVRQESERIVRGPDESDEVPALTYRTRAYVHLGSFDGPIVAMGDGEANSHEEKYRWRTAKATCPTCGREGLVRGKKESRLAGKWWCPAREGGCNSTFEPNATKPDGTLVVTPPGKVENTDPHSLAETLLQISAKRAFVASIRRATGTSGLFSQDDDSPSVRDQSAASGETDGAGPVVENATIGVPIAPGGRTTQATAVQHERLKVLAKEKGLGGAKIAELLERLFGMEVAATGAAASAAVRTLDADQMGALLQAVEFGEVPERPGGEPDPVALAMYPDDIGAK